MRDVTIDGEQVAVVGALDLDHTLTGIMPRRLPAWTRPQITDVMLDFVVQAPSGVRLRFRSDTTTVELDVMLTMLHWVPDEFEGATFDLRRRRRPGRAGPHRRPARSCTSTGGTKPM